MKIFYLFHPHVTCTPLHHITMFTTYPDRDSFIPSVSIHDKPEKLTTLCYMFVCVGNSERQKCN